MSDTTGFTPTEFSEYEKRVKDFEQESLQIGETKWSPMAIDLLLTCRVKGCLDIELDVTETAQKLCLERFMNEGVLRELFNKGDVKYYLTDKGLNFLHSILETPLPIK